MSAWWNVYTLGLDPNSLTGLRVRVSPLTPALLNAQHRGIWKGWLISRKSREDAEERDFS